MEADKTIRRNLDIEKMYLDCFPVFAGFVKKAGGSLEETRDVFQEALILYYEKTVTENFSPGISDQSYLIGICKNRFLKSRRQQVKTCSVEGLEFREENDPGQPSASKLLHYLKTSGEKCLQLLQSFYYESLTMKSLADRFGYSSERSATVQKYKCLEKVRESIREKSQTYEDFID